MRNITNGNHTKYAEHGIVGSPYTMAYDWVGNNMFVGNRIANNIEVLKNDGKNFYQSVIFDNNGNATSVGRPKAMAVDPLQGYVMYFFMS